MPEPEEHSGDRLVACKARLDLHPLRVSELASRSPRCCLKPDPPRARWLSCPKSGPGRPWASARQAAGGRAHAEHLSAGARQWHAGSLGPFHANVSWTPVHCHGLGRGAPRLSGIRVAFPLQSIPSPRCSGSPTLSPISKWLSHSLTRSKSPQLANKTVEDSPTVDSSRVPACPLRLRPRPRCEHPRQPARRTRPVSNG